MLSKPRLSLALRGLRAWVTKAEEALLECVLACLVLEILISSCRRLMQIEIKNKVRSVYKEIVPDHCWLRARVDYIELLALTYSCPTAPYEEPSFFPFPSHGKMDLLVRYTYAYRLALDLYG